jgi:hypothetical protein
MSIEFSDPKDLDQMRLDVHEWISDRPTIKHTNRSLLGILRSEVSELKEALNEHKPIPEISLEIGDVLFSTLALDNGAATICKPVYSAISKYCEVTGISLDKLYKDTWEKNSTNYNPLFFNEMSPFMSPKDAMKCLRIIRNHYGDYQQVDKVWSDYDAQTNEPFFDGYVSTGKFRRLY